MKDYQPVGISRACAHIFARSKCSLLTPLQHRPMQSCCSCYALVVKLLRLGERIVGKLNNRKSTDKHRQTDRRILATLALWNAVNLPLVVVSAVYASRHIERVEIDEDSVTDRVPERERPGVVFLRAHMLASQSSLRHRRRMGGKTPFLPPPPIIRREF